MINEDASNVSVESCETCEELKVGIYLAHEDAKMPTRAYANDVGADLYSLEDVIIEPGTFKEVRTGVHLALPDAVFAQINTRSSYGKEGLFIHNGVIDPGYTGELSLWVMNIASRVEDTGVVKKIPCTIKKGDKVAQLLFHNAVIPKLIQIDTLPKTERGDKGHGSSGK